MKRIVFLGSGTGWTNEIRRARTLAGRLVSFNAIWLTAAASLAGEPLPAKDTIEDAAKSDSSIYDEIWSLATLYKNKDNPYIQEIKLRGRYQGQHYWLDSRQGDADSWEDRRSRIGFDVKFLGDFSFRGDVQGSDGFDPVYNGIVDFFVKWSPADQFNLTVGKQKPQIGYYDWLQSTNSQPTFERSQIFNQLRVDRTLGAVIDGKAGNWLYQTGIYSNENDLEFGQLNAGIGYGVGVGYDFTKAVSLEKAEWRFDYLRSDIESGSTVLDRYENLFSTTLWLKDGRWSLVGEFFAGTGLSADAAGLFIQPTYDLIPKKLQVVGRYSFASGEGPDSIQAQSRYERSAPNLNGSGRGEVYNAFYVGTQYFIHGDKLKLLAGAEYAEVDGGGNGGDFDGWTYLAGVRLSF
jgi:phosphate-selective porin OprO and OprP